MRKRIITIIILLLAVMGLCNSIIDMAQLSIGYPTGNMIYSGIYIEYILFIIPVLFVSMVCISVLKRIYIKGSIVIGVITGLIMIIYATGYNSVNLLVVIYFICMGALSFAVAMYLMFKIRPQADEDMGLLAGIMRGLTYKNKFKGAFALFWLCIVCVIYIICPKKWVCLYVESQQFMNHSCEMDNDVLTIGEEIILVNALIDTSMDYEAGWKFYANKSGNTKVSILSEIEYEENDDWEEETWDIYVDDNLHVHYDADYEYYLKVYEFFFFVIINSMALCVAFLLSGFVDMRKANK